MGIEKDGDAKGTEEFHGCIESLARADTLYIYMAD